MCYYKLNLFDGKKIYTLGGMNMSNMSFRNKLWICFISIDVMFLLAALSSVVALNMGMKADVADSAKFMKGYLLFIVVALIVIYVVMTFISVFVLKTVRVHLDELKKTSTDIAEGIDTNEIPVTVKDEFGEVFEEFNYMIRSNRKQSELMKAVANGDLTVEVHPRSSGDIVGLALKQLVEQNRMSLSAVRNGAIQVDSAATEVASAAEALAQGSTEQASAIEEINASMDDVSVKTKTNAKQADDAVEIMNRAIEDMQKGTVQMKDMVNSMNDINVSSENISKIIKVIDDIAFQTNILALNAAVEAARAGDAGLGFAVVAEEVRNLAAKSAAAAAETAELIEDSIKKIHDGKGIADDTMKSFEAISADVAQTAEMVKNIAEASNYQATAIEQVNQAINQVSQVVSSNSATSEQCAAASVELSGQAKSIRESLAVYKLGSSDGFVQTSNYPVVSHPNEMIISLGDGFGKY